MAAALKPLRLRWYIFGAQAVIAAGAVRNTADLDITTDDVPVEKLRVALAKAGFTPRKDIPGIEELIEHHRILPLAHRTTGFRLDVVRAGPGLELEMLARPIFRRVGRSRIPFVDTNDLLVLKVLASRPQDLEDVRALLRSKSPEINLRVVRQRLRIMGNLIDDFTLVGVFEEQLAAAGLGSGTRKPARRRRR